MADKPLEERVAALERLYEAAMAFARSDAWADAGAELGAAFEPVLAALETLEPPKPAAAEAPAATAAGYTPMRSRRSLRRGTARA